MAGAFNQSTCEKRPSNTEKISHVDGGNASETDNKLEKLIKEMLVRGGNVIESEQVKLKEASGVGCQSTVSGATTGSVVSGLEANNLNKFLDIQINKNKAGAASQANN